MSANVRDHLASFVRRRRKAKLAGSVHRLMRIGSKESRCLRGSAAVTASQPTAYWAHKL